MTSIPVLAAPVHPVPVHTFVPVPDTLLSSVHLQYRYGKFGTTSILVPRIPVPYQHTLGQYGKAPTRQFHSNTHCCLWSDRTRKQRGSLALPSISKKIGTRCRSPSYKRFLERCSSPFMRLVETSRRLALGASNVCLVDENPTCSVPA